MFRIVPVVKGHASTAAEAVCEGETANEKERYRKKKELFFKKRKRAGQIKMKERKRCEGKKAA